MCNPASFVLTRDAVFFSRASNSHEDIIEEHGLNADGARGPNILRVEIAPADGDYGSPPKKWRYRTDQDLLPPWADSEKDEARTRRALKEWGKYHLCSQHDLKRNVQQVGGFMVGQTAGYGSTQTAGYGSTQTAGDGSTQTAGDGSTQTAGDGSTQICIFYQSGQWKTVARVLTAAEANKWYRFESECGTWRECTEAEIAEAEKKSG